MENTPTTIPEILELPAGTKGNASWINGSFQAVIRNSKGTPGRNNQLFYRADLHDPLNEGIKITGIGDLNLCQYEGQIVTFSGAGMSRSAYTSQNGSTYPQIRLSEKTMIAPVGVAPAPGQPAQATQQPAQQAQAARPQAQAAHTPAQAFGPREGVQVGNAMTNAVQAIGMAQLDVAPGSPQWTELLWQVASDICRVADFIKADKLAAQPTDRIAGDSAPEIHQPQQPQPVEVPTHGTLPDGTPVQNVQGQVVTQPPPAQQMTAGPDGSAFAPDPTEDDVPF